MKAYQKILAAGLVVLWVLSVVFYLNFYSNSISIHIDRETIVNSLMESHSGPSFAVEKSWKFQFVKTQLSGVIHHYLSDTVITESRTTN